MPLQRLKQAQKRIAGSKQTLKAIQQGQAKVVYIALDAEKKITEPIMQACLAKSIPVIEVDNMRLLGKTCGIEVNCASAAIIEE